MESVLDDLEAAISINENDVSHPADPASPTVPIQVKNEPDTPNTAETDDERIILTLESLHYSTESTESAKKLQENQKALEKLDKLLQTNNITRKKIAKSGNGGKNSNASLVTVKTVSEKKAPRILNATLAKSPNPDSKRLLNNIGKSIPSEADLLAILEGNNQDEETEVDVKVIEDTGNKKTVTTVLLSKNQELKIAADQMKEISRKSNFKLNMGNTTNTNEVTSSTNELINAIVSEWSDNEREISEEKIEMTLIPKQGLKQNIKKRKLEPKVVVVSAPANSNEDQVEVENIDIKVEKPELTTGIAPFKRSRIIKKKIIWDPDAPETQFSYASLIKPKTKQNTTKRVASKGAVTGSVNKLENRSFTKKATEKKTTLSGRKRKEVSPDKLGNDKLEEALNEILSEEIDSTIKSSTKDSVISPVKSKEIPQAKKPRMTKAKQAGSTSSSWDYINKGRSDEMMIIRRRSSSYSSTASQRRVSGELQQQLQRNSSPKSIKISKKVTAEQLKAFATKKRKQEIQLKKVTATTIENSENSVKVLPVVKKLSIAETKKLAPPSPTLQPTSVTKKLNKQMSASDADKVLVSSSTNLKPQKVEKKIIKVSEDKPKPEIEVILKRSDSVVNFIIDLKTDNATNTFNIEFIKKFVSTLEHLKKDNTCKIVVVTSKGAHFCQGIDFSCLVTPSLEKRKVIANELAKNVKLLFEALINFNKPIIAAVGGLVSNLGVTMLPLFDFVFASDKCAFEMTYSKIGQIPEGNCILNTINMDKKYKMKLIYLAEKLTASEALSAGLLSVIFPVQRFEAEAINTATKMASLSQQAYKSMKQSCIKTFTNETFTRLFEEEFKCLVDHYISAECQEKFKELMKK
ncbi:uncharacterized protein LOC129610077 [Condylostylus longicornis]|uniref:uncharacterized protein LOC129610077 n=1 Tax=Condylostylus longicornis TaxID=2530218 RepID=UPI00244E3814|nr:uncharacterized protein LOC129610077 [Condylostylus longicornis]